MFLLAPASAGFGDTVTIELPALLVYLIVGVTVATFIFLLISSVLEWREGGKVRNVWLDLRLISDILRIVALPAGIIGALVALWLNIWVGVIAAIVTVVAIWLTAYLREKPKKVIDPWLET